MPHMSFHRRSDESSLQSQTQSRTCGQRLAFGLFMTLTGGQAIAAGGFNTNEQAVFNALNACAQAPTDRNSPICFAGTNPANIKSLNPDQIFGIGSMAARVNGGKTTQPYDYAHLKRIKRKGGGAGDDDFSPLSFWGNVDSNFGARNTTTNLTGFEYDNHNFVSGADYRLQDNWVVGGLFSYRHNNATFDTNRGETTNDSYTGGLYSSYNITDSLHIDGMASYGGFAYDTTRNINLVDFGSSVAQGSTNGGQYAFSGTAGYDFNFNALTIMPYLRGEYMDLSVDGYSESGSIAAVRFGKQNIESMTSSLGVQTSYTFSMPWGVLIPQLRGEWHHQYRDGRRHIQASFVTDASGQNFTMTGGLPVRDYFTFGAEVSSVLPGGVSAFLSYETLQGYTDISSNRFMLGTRMEF